MFYVLTYSNFIHTVSAGNGGSTGARVRYQEFMIMEFTLDSEQGMPLKLTERS